MRTSCARSSATSLDIRDAANPRILSRNRARISSRSTGQAHHKLPRGKEEACRLPDPAGRAPHHRLPKAATESLLEFRHVLDHAVYAILRPGMRIRQSVQTRGFLLRVLAPALRVAYEEALLRSELIDLGQALAGNLVEKRHVGDPQSAVIGRILAQSELAVQLDVFGYGELRVLIRQAVRALFEFRRVLCRPPVAQVAFGIEFPPFIVKPVRQLVADHRADRAEV